MATEQSLVDMEVLDETADLGLDDLCELIDVYLNQATEVMGKLQTAIDGKRANDVRELSHRLAGSSAACGASAVMMTLREIERCGREDDLALAADLFQQAVALLKTTERFYSDYVGPKGMAIKESFIPPKVA